MELWFVLLFLVVVACLGFLCCLCFFLGGGGEGDKNCEEEQAEKHTLKVPSYVTNVIFFLFTRVFPKHLCQTHLSYREAETMPFESSLTHLRNNTSVFS